MLNLSLLSFPKAVILQLSTKEIKDPQVIYNVLPWTITIFDSQSPHKNIGTLKNIRLLFCKVNNKT